VKYPAFSVRNELDKVATVGGCINAGVCGRSPQPPEANRVGDGSPDAEAYFYSFFQNNAFSSII